MNSSEIVSGFGRSKRVYDTWYDHAQHYNQPTDLDAHVDAIVEFTPNQALALRGAV